MSSDVVVALARATTDGRTYFGHNSTCTGRQGPSLMHLPGGEHAPDEVVRATHIRLPQARHTWAVLGSRAGTGGLHNGVNERGVAIGWTATRTRLVGDGPGLTGPDLVRLGLERAGSARQAIEVITELIGRHGQGPWTAAPDEPDSALLIADGQEACLLEATGRHWVLALVGSVRAVTGTCLLRQDWDRISRGLADLAIQEGWWPQDGCKLDFAGSLTDPGPEHVREVRRWGRATVLLEQHSGQIDAGFCRRLLRDLGEGGGAGEAPPGEFGQATSLLVRLGSETDSLPIAWWAVGGPWAAVWLPIFPAAGLPPSYSDLLGEGCPLWWQLVRWQAECQRDPRLRVPLRAGLVGLQQEIDGFTHEFLPEADDLHRSGRRDELRRLAGSFAQHACERLEDLLERLKPRPGSRQQESEVGDQQSVKT